MTGINRLALVQDIWDSVAIEAGLVPPSAAEISELDCRLDEDGAAPDNTIFWETIKTEATKRWQR